MLELRATRSRDILRSGGHIAEKGRTKCGLNLKDLNLCRRRDACGHLCNLKRGHEGPDECMLLFGGGKRPTGCFVTCTRCAAKARRSPGRQPDSKRRKSALRRPNSKMSRTTEAPARNRSREGGRKITGEKRITASR